MKKGKKSHIKNFDFLFKFVCFKKYNIEKIGQ